MSMLHSINRVPLLKLLGHTLKRSSPNKIWGFRTKPEPSFVFRSNSHQRRSFVFFREGRQTVACPIERQSSPSHLSISPSVELVQHPKMLARTILRTPKPRFAPPLRIFLRSYATPSNNSSNQPGSFLLNLGQEPQPGESLKKYSIDLTELAKEGKLDPVIGRDDEIRRTIQILSRRTKNNPALVGAAGVGKTAIMVISLP